MSSETKPTNNNHKNKSTRKATGSNVNPRAVRSALIQSITPLRLRSPADPPVVETQVRCTKVLHTQVTFASGSQPWNLTYATVASMIPGGQTYWYKIRILKVVVWGSAADGHGESDQLRVTVAANDAWGVPVAQFIDSGTAGSKRPCIAYQSDVLTSMRALGTASTEDVCTIAQVPTESGTENIAVIHVTAELLGPVGY